MLKIQFQEYNQTIYKEHDIDNVDLNLTTIPENGGTITLKLAGRVPFTINLDRKTATRIAQAYLESQVEPKRTITINLEGHGPVVLTGIALERTFLGNSVLQAGVMEINFKNGKSARLVAADALSAAVLEENARVQLESENAL